MDILHLRLVPPTLDQREAFDRLAAKGVLCAARRLRAHGIDSPQLAVDVATEAMQEFMEHFHAHLGGHEAFRLLCAAIERRVDRSAGKAGKAN